MTWVYDIGRGHGHLVVPDRGVLRVRGGRAGVLRATRARRRPGVAGGPGRRRRRPTGVVGPEPRSPRRRRRGAPARTDPGPDPPGLPPAEFDLHMTVHCPDGVAPQRGGPGLPHGRSERLRPSVEQPPDAVLRRRRGRCDRPAAVRDANSARWSTATGCSPRSPPTWCFVHQNGRLVYGNRAAARMTGSAPTDEEYARRSPSTTAARSPTSCTRATSPTWPSAWPSSPSRGSSSSTARSGRLHPDGTATVMEVTSIRTTWAGEPAYQVIARDISERRAAEAANRYRASLVAHVSDAIIGIDADGMIESWNEAAQAIYGWTEDEVAGMSIGAVVTANRTDSAAVLERGQRTHRAQGRLLGGRDGVHRPAHRRRHPAVRLGRGVHRADRRPPGRGRSPGRRGAVRGGGGLAERGHRALRRVRAGSPPTTRPPAASSGSG